MRQTNHEISTGTEYPGSQRLNEANLAGKTGNIAVGNTNLGPKFIKIDHSELDITIPDITFSPEDLISDEPDKSYTPIQIGDSTVELGKREYCIFRFLAENPNKTLFNEDFRNAGIVFRESEKRHGGIFASKILSLINKLDKAGYPELVVRQKIQDQTYYMFLDGAVDREQIPTPHRKGNYEINVRGKSLIFPPAEYKILRALATYPNQALSSDDILRLGAKFGTNKLSHKNTFGLAMRSLIQKLIDNDLQDILYKTGKAGGTRYQLNLEPENIPEGLTLTEQEMKENERQAVQSGYLTKREKPAKSATPKQNPLLAPTGRRPQIRQIKNSNRPRLNLDPPAAEPKKTANLHVFQPFEKIESLPETFLGRVRRFLETTELTSNSSAPETTDLTVSELTKSAQKIIDTIENQHIDHSAEQELAEQTSILIRAYTSLLLTGVRFTDQQKTLVAGAVAGMIEKRADFISNLAIKWLAKKGVTNQTPGFIQLRKQAFHIAKQAYTEGLFSYRPNKDSDLETACIDTIHKALASSDL